MRVGPGVGVEVFRGSRFLAAPLEDLVVPGTAFGCPDLTTFCRLDNADLVWHQPGANRFSGSHTGLAGFEALIGGMMQTSGGTFQLSVTGEPMVNGDKVAVPVRFQAKREGHEMDMGGIDLLTVREGSIVEVHLFSSDGPAEDRFWGVV